MESKANSAIYIVWALFYTLLSMLLGFVATRLFKLPSWITPALCFNNTTSLPLLLVQSFEATGILSRLLGSDSDTTFEAVKRAKSYFLVCSIVGNSLTFALGPKLLDGEESPDEEEEDQKKLTENGNENGAARGGDLEHGQSQNGGAQQHAEDSAFVNEQTSLLPDRVVRESERAGNKSYAKGKFYWDRLPSWIRSFLDFMYAFLNAPLIGAVIGAILGLAPPLHRAFFNTQQEGGFFNAWFTTSVENIGGLFATLQVVVVGVKLSSSLRKMKRGEDSGSVPWKPTLFVLTVRFIIWPMYVLLLSQCRVKPTF